MCRSDYTNESPEHIENRKWSRYQISFPITIEWKGRQINHVLVQNICLGGLICLLSKELSVGERVKILINLPAPEKKLNSAEIFFKARVARVDTKKEKGDRKYRETAFEFINMDTNFGSLLQAYLDLENSRGNAKKISLRKSS